MNHTFKTRTLLWVVLFFRKISEYFDHKLDREWDRIVHKEDNKEAPPLLKNH